MLMFPESLHRVLPESVDFLPGQSIPLDEQSDRYLYLLLIGCVTQENGSTGATAAVFWPGDLVTVPIEASGPPSLLRAVAASRCLRGKKRDLIDEAAGDRDVGRWLWQQFERRVTELHRRVDLLTRESVERRVLLTLADLADRALDRINDPTLPLAQKEVAELAGATRETTSTLLNRMRRQGLVSLGRRRIHVTSPSQLRALETVMDIQPLEMAVAVAAGA